jgi:hypothetical protein
MSFSTLTSSCGEMLAPCLRIKKRRMTAPKPQDMMSRKARFKELTVLFCVFLFDIT